MFIFGSPSLTAPAGNSDCDKNKTHTDTLHLRWRAWGSSLPMCLGNFSSAHVAPESSVFTEYFRAATIHQSQNQHWHKIHTVIHFMIYHLQNNDWHAFSQPEQLLSTISLSKGKIVHSWVIVNMVTASLCVGVCNNLVLKVFWTHTNVPHTIRSCHQEMPQP